MHASGLVTVSITRRRVLIRCTMTTPIVHPKHRACYTGESLLWASSTSPTAAVIPTVTIDRRDRYSNTVPPPSVLGATETSTALIVGRYTNLLFTYLVTYSFRPNYEPLLGHLVHSRLRTDSFFWTSAQCKRLARLLTYFLTHFPLGGRACRAYNTHSAKLLT